MSKLGIVADDLTGATTTGVLLARSGSKTMVFFHTDAAEKYSHERELDSLLISTSSRPLPHDEAYRAVTKATKVLKEAGVKYFSKRIDTTMRGGIGTEIDAMLAQLPSDSIAIVVPAMPQSRRILVGGYSIIDSVTLTKTAVAQDVRTPVKEAYIPKLLQAQTKTSVGLVMLSEVLNGIDSIKDAFQAQINSGHRIIIVDAVSLEDVSNIAKAAIQLNRDILAVDPGPFTSQLAFHRHLLHEEKANIPKRDDCEREQTVLIVAGSATSVTKKQMEVLCQDPRNIRISIDPVALIEGGVVADKEANRVVNEIDSLVNKGVQPRAILLETALHGVLLDLNQQDTNRDFVAGESAERINAGLGTIVANIFEKIGSRYFAGIYATGGDTMFNICNQLGVSAIEVIDYVIPQTDIGRLVGNYDGMPIVGKGGLTGDDHIASKIVDRIFLEACRNRNS